jgi:hypothetical protein
LKDLALKLELAGLRLKPKLTEQIELVAQQYIDGFQAIPDELTQTLAMQIKLLIANKKSSEYQNMLDKNITSTIQYAFATGNTQSAQRAIVQARKFNGNEHQVFKKVKDKEQSSRDDHMISSILSNLRQCTQMNETLLLLEKIISKGITKI